MHNHFDDSAATWDQDDEKVTRARTVADALAGVIVLRGDESLLEYGAGTGLVAQALGDRVGHVTLADSSAGMREVMQRKIADGALPPAAQVWSLDLMTDDAPPERFDLVVSSLVLHHIPDLPKVLAGFHTLLKADGYVGIADLDKEDGSFHEHLHDFDGHDGFDRDELATQLQEVGFDEVRFTDCGSLRKQDKDYGFFLATARRP